MNKTVIWSPEAKQELFRGAEYIAKDSVSNALGFIDYVEDKTNLLFNEPELGFPWKEEPLRKLVLGKYQYCIFYEIVGDEVHIIRLKHDKLEK